MRPLTPPTLTGRPRALAQRQALLVARSGLLRASLALEVQMLDAQVGQRAAQALRWFGLARRACGWAALLLPLLQRRRPGRRGVRRLPALLWAGLRTAPLLLRVGRLLGSLRRRSPPTPG